jgi:hypothetical protein
MPITVLPGAGAAVPSNVQPQPTPSQSLASPAVAAIVPEPDFPDDGPLLVPSTGIGGASWPGTNVAPWTWHVLPDGLMYRSYLAGPREPRFASEWVHEEHRGWIWDATLGARVGLIRLGTQDALWPEGWQLDAEAAAFPRLSGDRDLISNDFRVGVPLTTRMGPWETKLGYYHISSHLADEFMVNADSLDRINYVRDCVVLGLAYRPGPDWRLYGETAYAFHTDGGAEPWEFQFGVEYSPARPTGFRGAPFLAVNGSLRQEVDYGGSLTAQAGWQWRGVSGKLARLGVHYFNGKSEQRQFFREFEEQLGLGLWYDF